MHTASATSSCYPNRSYPSRYRAVIVTLLLSLGMTPALHAAAEIIILVESSGGAGRLTATLTAAGGNPQSAEDGDGDGVLVLTPNAGPGDYELAVDFSGQRQTRTVTVPEDGLVTVTYRLTAPDDKILVTYSGLDFGNEEILVTARRREENLQSAPVSITAFTDDSLRQRSMRNLRNIGEATPNLHFSLGSGINGAASEATVFIRGIGHLGTNIFEDPAVGIYVDGVYLARAQGSVFDLLDLERVEVLRGPQGTLFGKNTIGGAVSLVTRKPGNDFHGEAEITLGDLDRRDLKARVSGPLSETVFGSLAAYHTRRDGYARSLATGEVFNDDDRFVTRGALRFLPADHIVVDFTTDFTREEINGLDQVLVDVGDDDPANFVVFYNRAMELAGFPTYSAEFVSTDLYSSYSGSPNVHDGDVWGATLRTDALWKAGNLTSITAYRTLDFDDVSDRDGIPQVFVDVAARQQQEQISQEVRWSGLALDDRLTYLIGGLYLDERSDSTGETTILALLFDALERAPGPIISPPGAPSFLCDPGPPPPGVPCFGGAGNPLNAVFGTGFSDIVDHRTTSWALFGHGTLAIGDRLSLSAGLRYTLEEKDFAVDRLLKPFGIPVQLANQDDWDALSPKLGVEFQITPEHLVYGSVSWGFKSGGFNGITQGRNDLDPFDPEKITAYEAGWKSDWFDNRLRLNGAVFFNDYEDIQFTTAVAEGTVISFPIRNAGAAETRGFELELVARPVRHFELTAGVGYLDTEYTELLAPGPGGPPSLDGVFPKSPDWTVHVSPAWTFAVGDAGTVAIRADYSYRGKVFHDVFNSETAAQDGYSLVNSRLSFETASQRWEVSLFGTNLGDEAYIENGLFVAGFGPTLVVAGRPREWGLSTRYRF